MNKKVSIILSTYNEAEVIEDTIKKIFETLENVEIVLVDDNSSDGTYEIVKEINNPNLKIYSREARGLASAFLLGLINTNGDVVGWIDSNMSFLTKRLPEMIENLSENDLVLLSRYVNGGNDQRSNLRVLSSQLINYICRFFLSSEIKDYTSGIFLMKREVLLKAVPISYGHGDFFIEFLYKALIKGVKIVELPYTQPPDIEGNSKTASSLLRFFSLGLDYLVRILRIRFRKN